MNEEFSFKWKIFLIINHAYTKIHGIDPKIKFVFK